MTKSRNRMWMGTRGFERWVPAPKINADFSSIGNREQDQYLNGGAGIRGTKDSHKEYNLTWSSKRREELAPVLNLASGLFDTGEGTDLVYFIDPTVYDWNVLPAMLASPYKTALDGIPLTLDEEGYPLYPTLERGTSNTRGYPARAASYALTTTTNLRTTYLPIPPGKTLWMGAHGAGDGASLAVTPYGTGSAYPTETLELLAVDTDVRVNTSWSASEGYTGVEIGLGLLSGRSTGTVTLQGVIGQILDDGVPPFPGDFIAGEGNSGCEFPSMPTLSPYLGGKQWSMAAKAVETGSWR